MWLLSLAWGSCHYSSFQHSHCLLLVKFPFCKWVVCTLELSNGIPSKRGKCWIHFIFRFHIYYYFSTLLLPFESSISTENKCYVLLYMSEYIQFNFTAITNIAGKESAIILVMAFKKELYGLHSVLRIARPGLFWDKQCRVCCASPSRHYLSLVWNHLWRIISRH